MRHRLVRCSSMARNAQPGTSRSAPETDSSAISALQLLRPGGCLRSTPSCHRSAQAFAVAFGCSAQFRESTGRHNRELTSQSLLHVQLPVSARTSFADLFRSAKHPELDYSMKAKSISFARLLSLVIAAGAFSVISSTGVAQERDTSTAT